MDSGFASKMSEAVDTLQSGFKSFVSGTITGGVWEGEASENARNQVSSKIDPKVEEVKLKLQNLISAIGLVADAQVAKENKEAAEKRLAELEQNEKDAVNFEEVKKELTDAIKKYEEEFKSKVEEINNLCKV